MRAERTLSADALDAAFPFRITLDETLTLVSLGPGLADTELRVGAKADEGILPLDQGLSITWKSLLGHEGAQVLLQPRGGRRLAAVIARDPGSGLLHLLARSAERALDEDRAGYVLLEELARASSADLDTALRRLLPAAAAFIDVDRVSYATLSGDASFLVYEGLHLRPTGEFERGLELYARDYPTYFATLQRGEVIAAHDAQHDARTREFTDGYLRPLGIGAMLDAPVFVGGTLAGVLCHEHVGEARVFSARDQQVAVAVAQAISQVLGARERRRAEEVVRTSEARFRALSEASPIAVLVTAVGDGQVLYANHELAAMLRSTPGELLARRSVDFYADPSQRARIIERIRREGLAREEELLIKRPDGSSFWGMLSAQPTVFDGHQAFLCGIVDMTEHKNSEARVRSVLRTLEERDALMTDDLARARAFQEALLPRAIERGDVRIEATHRPVDGVSGDLYDVEVVDDRYLRVFLADATGHGVSAALTTMFLRSEYDVASRDELSPGAVLRALNARMGRFHERLAMRFTAACLTLDLRTGHLRWSTAAHPAMCLVRDGTVTELDTGGTFVGLSAHAEFAEWSLSLRPGDSVCAFTDGLTEALDDEGRPLGERALYDALGRASRAGRALAAEALRAALDHAPTPRDDIAVVVATWRPADREG